MLRIRKKVSRHVYQYSSFSRNLNPIKHVRLTLQQIELASYRDAQGGVEPNWQTNMNTGIRAVTAATLRHIGRTTRHVMSTTWHLTAHTVTKALTMSYRVAHTFFRLLGALCVSVLRVLNSCITALRKLMSRQVFRATRALTLALQRLNPKPLLHKGTIVTHKVTQLAGSGREYLTENIATTILVCFLVFVSSFMAYQTLAYYIARIIG